MTHNTYTSKFCCQYHIVITSLPVLYHHNFTASIIPSQFHCQYYTIVNSLPVLYYHNFITCIIPSQLHCHYYTITTSLPSSYDYNCKDKTSFSCSNRNCVRYFGTIYCCSFVSYIVDHGQEFVNAQPSNEADSCKVKQNQKYNLPKNGNSCVKMKINCFLLEASVAWIKEAKM
jgi:hypothetical protein